MIRLQSLQVINGKTDLTRQLRAELKYPGIHQSHSKGRNAERAEGEHGKECKRQTQLMG